MKHYDFRAIEKKWQHIWEEKKVFCADDTSKKKKYYCLEMFPYPSGRIHMGHVRNYVIGDVMARFFKMKGHEVIHPIGWDAFGLPAENAAIKHHAHPEQWTRSNIKQMKEDLQEIGIGYDWNREFATCDKEYYHWNQWLFLKLYEKGLAYQKEAHVNWCPSCQTVLANEQVSSRNTCWRCDSVVENKHLKQWFLKITAYAEQLLDDLTLLKDNWPDEILLMQNNWIGRSFGAEVVFSTHEGNKITVFTTRPDTLFGTTYMVLAPEHPLVLKLIRGKKIESHVHHFIADLKKCKTAERTGEATEKKGIFLESYCINPVNKEIIPIWIANYVLMEYGCGAIMAVPAHDQRDYDFAKQYDIPIREVIRGDNPLLIAKQAYTGDGIMVNSGKFDGMPSQKAAKQIIQQLENSKMGSARIQYRLRDWLISRQRYWGTPIPIIHCDRCGIVPIPEKDLPVTLPSGVTLTGQGRSPLEQTDDFIRTQCPRCSRQARREADTMDTFVDSSWYFLRFCDPGNTVQLCEKHKANRWMPVDLYIGGIEHACMHLIYARFIHKFMRDIGLVACAEPFSRLLSQGMVTLGGTAMSKSRGNIVESSTIVNKYGADTGRLFILFASPPDKNLEWTDTGIEGSFRFLNRLWRLASRLNDRPKNKGSAETEMHLRRFIHARLKRVTRDIAERCQLNTAISAIMELVNELSSYDDTQSPAFREGIRLTVIMLYPFAPHICEELWKEVLNENTCLYEEPWPETDEQVLVEESAEVIIQVNGRLRSKISIPVNEPEEKIKQLAANDPKIKQWIEGKTLIKTIYRPKQLINFVIK